jgi:tetratricopeptide (TPR) repeat protein
MLETIREYATEKLEESSEADELRRKHAEHFLNLAEEGTFVLMDSTWADRVDSELDNVRGALDFAAATGESQRILRATASLRDYWFTRGYIAEALTRLENALSADIAPTPARCSALVAASMAAMMAGDDALARERADEAMSLADSLGDPYLSALARCQDAWVLTEGARWSEALAILDDVVPVLRDLGAWDVAIAANRTRAWMYEELGERDQALTLYTENLDHSRAHGHRRIEARSLGVLAEIAADEGRLDEARDLLLASFRIDQELGNVPFMTVDLVRFAAVYIRDGEAEVAARLIGRAVAGFEEIGFSLESWMTRELNQATEAAQAQLDQASFTAAWEAGARMSLDDAIALALGQTELDM